MALADIIRRIDGDATDEATTIVRAAQAQAEAMLAAARAEADHASAVALARAAGEASAEAETVRAAARLTARDRLVAAKGELVDRVLDGVASVIVGLPDDAYVALIARRVAAASRGGERLLIAATDRARLEWRLPRAIALAAGRDLGLEIAEEPADVEHGVVLLGDRSSVDLSVAALVAERREQLSMIAAGVLFETDDGAGLSDEGARAASAGVADAEA